MRDLSIIIPARNEEFLNNIINNILNNKCGNTEIIVILDGYNPSNKIINTDVTYFYFPEAIGQRAGVNEGVKVSNAKYIMKLDAHCAVDKDFDIKLMEHCEHDWTVIPRMYNLHAFNWVCDNCNNSLYQGPKPEKCEKCNYELFHKEIIWKPRLSRRTDFMRFDSEMKFQYWPEYEKCKESMGDIVPLMSSIGACFFMERTRFWELDGMDEKHGSWGQFGTEIACKSWLSGGQHMVNKNTWFAHMFRTNKDFGFPYPIKFSDQEAARIYSKDFWINNKWPKAIRKLQWIIDKFKPIPGWHFIDNSIKKKKRQN